MFLRISVIDSRAAPSKPSKHPSKRHTTDNDGRRSPLQPLDFGLPAKPLFSGQPKPLAESVPKTSNLLRPSAQANAILPSAMPLGHIRETLPMPFILQQPEEQTDNWDDDFEEGISLSKLQGEQCPVVRLRGSTLNDVCGKRWRRRRRWMRSRRSRIMHRRSVQGAVQHLGLSRSR